jgi:hypothetical protein
MMFPRLRATGEAFSAWVDRVAAEERADAGVDEGIGLLDPAERARIVRSHREDFPAVWDSFREDVGDDASASGALLSGAVLAAVRERAEPDPRMLALLEELEEMRADHCSALALVLEAGDLWSVHESFEADAALAALPDGLAEEEYEARWEHILASESERLADDWHHERLAALVRRLRDRLPLGGYPAASGALAAACGEFEHEARFRSRLLTLLLADSLSWMRVGFVPRPGEQKQAA